MVCPRCFRETNENICPNCGNNLSMNNNMPTGNQINNFNNKKKGINLKIIICIVAGLIILGIVYFLINSGEKSGNSSTTVESSSFFLSDGNKYALFNTDGKRLTDFIYKNAEYTVFNNGVTLLYIDDAAKVINESGKIIIDGNKENNVVSELGEFYRILDGTKNKIVNYKNKVLAEIPSDTSYTPNYSGSYLLLEYDNSYTLYNKEGKELLKGKKTTDDENQFSIYDKYGYMIAFIEGKNYLFDSKDKIVAEFESDKRYSLEELVNGDLLIEHGLDGSSMRNTGRKVFSKAKGKVYDIPDEWRKISFVGTQAMTTVGFETYYLNEEYKLGKEFKRNYEEFFNENIYAFRENGGINFYKNGNVVANVPNLDLNLGYNGNNQMDDFYILYQYAEKMYYAYDKDGKQLFGASFLTLDRSGDGIYRVKTKDSKMYLMDKNGKKLTKEYDNIYYEPTDNNVYYEVTNGDIKQILDKKEKKIYECSRKCELAIKTYLGNDYAEVKENSTLVALVDLKAKKEVVRSNQIKINKKYIYVTEGNKTKYYTFGGKLFYEK